MTAPPVPVRAELRDQLVRTRIAGAVATPRHGNLRHYREMAAGDPRHLFGLRLSGDWTFDRILALMAGRCGVNPDPAYTHGADTIDPDRTIDALEAMAERIAVTAARGGPVVLATGHPAGLLPVYLALAQALRARGCPILTPAQGWTQQVDTPRGPRPVHIRYLNGVATVSGGGGLQHTHAPDPMRGMLAELRAADAAWPELAIADHGWAGAAGEAGIDTVGFADSNDPALFAGEAEGKIVATVPLDDNVFPQHYEPLTTYLLARADLSS